jgi:hypothetical protein
MIPFDDGQAHALTEHREEAWHYDLLNLQDKKVGDLDGVTNGSFDFSVAATIRSGGSITCQGQGIDWLKVRIQPRYTMTAGEYTLEWPLGVFIPASPNVDYSTPGGTRTIELYDKLLILDRDETDGTYSVAAGAVVTTVVRGILVAAGEVRDAITDSTAVMRTSQVWEAGTTKLKIVNELLASINYFSLWVDGYGVFHGTPYTDPGARGTAWTFADNADSIYSAAFTVDEDSFDVPNKVTLISTSDGDTAAMTATALNENPDSKYSFNQRQIWISKTETEIEAADQGTLNLLAQRRLVELTGTTETFNIDHAYIPLDLNDAVQFTRAAESISTRAVVQSMTISTEVGAPVKTTFRGVAL